MADNLDQTQSDNLDQQADVTQDPIASETPTSWKSSLINDIKNSPLLQKFEDTPEGLTKAFESHSELEKLLGHEKVPIPKSTDDVDGWNRFSKAMGIPDKAEGYGLPDSNLAPELKEMAVDKNRFAELAHSFKLTPNQTKGLWQAYNDITQESFNKYQQENVKNLQSVVNQLRSEWGDAYDSNVELGQMVINKFADSKEMEDYLTSSLSKDPRGVKFLAKLGNQFAENKIGEFGYKRFSLTPEQAQGEIDKILRDPSHPYLNDKATPSERQRAIDYVNSLYASIAKAKGQAETILPL